MWQLKRRNRIHQHSKRGYGSGSSVTDGIRSINTTNAADAPVSSSTIDIASGLTLSSETYTTDEFGRVTRTDYNDGTYVSTVYGCCGPSEQLNREGAITVTAYDELKRIDHTSTDGITQLFSYDPEGRVLMSVVKGRDNTELTTVNAYNAAGDLIAVTTPDNQVTSYAESWITENEQECRVRTTTHPDGSTLIEKFNLDGSLAEISGTATRRVKYEYGVENGELYTIIIQVGDNDAETQWSKTFTNFTGQQYKTVHADNSQALAAFDAANRPVKQTSPAGVVTLTAYNTQGEVAASAIDMNANDTIDYASTDRVTGYENNKKGIMKCYANKDTCKSAGCVLKNGREIKIVNGITTTI